MPAVSEKQRRAMWAAANGHSTLGIPQEVGREFVKADGEKKRCAGVVFRAPGPKYLLIKRADNGVWEQPGGHLEAGESFEDAARREAREEIGDHPDGFLWPLRVNDGDVVYATFVQNVAEEFVPTLNHESVEHAWVSPDAAAAVMAHPELVKTLDLLSGNELDLARRMAAGEVLSPQPYANVWLFDIRITGTGTAYRPAHNEFVFRPPENFLTPEFVARCNGLPVIFEHPNGTILNSDEFKARVIGTILYPYIQTDEVWGIAKVFDEDAVPLMRTTHPSTSPAVVFRDAGSTETVEVDGQTVLIEGSPSYLDHIAICPVGVWDKGGEPAGINNGDLTMEENKEVKQEEKRGDAEMPAWADALSKKLDSVCSRMDALEAKGETKPAEELKADKKGDSAEEPKEEKKADSAETKEEKAMEKKEEARADSADVAQMQAEIADLRQRLAGVTTPLSHADRDALAVAQGRADALAHMFGDHVTAPLYGESPLAYRKRLAAVFQKHSSKFKDVKLDAIDGPTFDLVEQTIYADAHTAAMNPADAPAGRLIPMRETDAAGRTITRYAGDISAWLGPFMAPGQTVAIRRQAARV